jgi:type VI secretion system ImpC/EvpB family protein
MNQPSTSPALDSTVLTQDFLPEPIAIPSPARGLLDAVLEATSAASSAAAPLERFLQEKSPARALAQWLGAIPAYNTAALKQHIAQRLARDIARIDRLLNAQVNAILHHPDLQKLEASWRSLYFLVHQVPEGSEKQVKIKMLNVSWKELTRDLTVRTLEFDQSQLFRKVYSDEFGMPGGEPYSVLLGDYEVRHKPSADHPYNDLDTLAAISGVAAAAFAPFIASAHPALLELTSFADLAKPMDLSRTFDHLDYLKWKAFRKTDDARYVGLTLPHVLARTPYDDDSARTDGFRFKEDVAGHDRSKYLWGNACYAFGAVLIGAFVESGWLADIRGARRGNEISGGMVAGLPVHHFTTDKRGVAPKCSTDTIITDAQEKELGMLGFIPLCHCQDTELAAFYGNQSLQEPKEYSENTASINARLSAMLQYILCAARFAHYVKVMGRDRVGSFARANELQNYLRNWLQNYITSNDKAGPKFPLREGRVEVEELADKPGTYTCKMYLRPHYQLDQMATVLKMESTLAPAKS